MLASLTLLEWGAVLIYFFFSGRLASLLHPNFHALVLLTGVLLSASGILLLWRVESDSPEHACDDGCCDSPVRFSLGRLPAFLVLVVPIALATVISPDKYGSVMVRNRGTVETLDTASSDTQSAPKHVAGPDGPAIVEVGDLLIAAQTKPGMAQYDGKRVEVIGQITPLGDKEFEVVRMLMLCCAADAQMLAVRVQSDPRPPLQPMQWVKVMGRVNFAKKGDLEVPIITAESVVVAPEPADRYVYRGGTRRSAPTHSFKLQLPPR